MQSLLFKAGFVKIKEMYVILAGLTPEGVRIELAQFSNLVTTIG